MYDANTDDDGDGIDDTVSGVRTEPVITALLRYEVTDKAGNRASCTMDVAVVDLEDPVITCPTTITSVSMPQIDGAPNVYTHPPGAQNIDRVLVYR